ncbi:MAG: hypothetical protein AMS20_03680 [Gemmatimonas sp. SG8_28]|nr:MAG: hypothetical protein AMS20_03680 [Gemmatimonas sp. SG8_28]
MAQRMSRVAVIALALAILGCGGGQPEEPVEPVSLPLPTAVVAGRKIALYPVTLVATESSLGWNDVIGSRVEARQRADSVIEAYLLERVPEAEWVLPDVLRRAAAQAPGMLSDPDKMGTALLRAEGIEKIPDPLRSQLRNLTAIVADRYALIPAALTFTPAEGGGGEAQLTLVLVDVRFGILAWRSVAAGEADSPWEALWEALTTLVPDLP